MRAPRAIVFDLDGTIADTRRDIAAACNHALAAVGRRPKGVDVIAGFVGDGARLLVSRALGVPPEDAVAVDAFAHFESYYAAHAADFSAWMPGAQETLAACAAIPLALVTNKPRSATLPLLKALGLVGHFQTVVAGGDGPLKPDRAPILRALAPLGVAPEDAWVVGDGPQDIGAGRAAGTWTVAVLGGFGTELALRAAGPDCVLASLSLFPALLRDSREAR